MNTTKKRGPSVVGSIYCPSTNGVDRMLVNVYAFHGANDLWAVTRERGNHAEREFNVTVNAYSPAIHGRRIGGDLEYSFDDATRLARWLARHPFWSTFDGSTQPTKEQVRELGLALHTASIGRDPITEMIQPIKVNR